MRPLLAIPISARTATEFVLYKEGNQVCFNISYKFRPLTRRLDGRASLKFNCYGTRPLLMKFFRLDAALLLTSSIQMPFRAVPV
jgi:hypothetical protein